MEKNTVNDNNIPNESADIDDDSTAEYNTYEIYFANDTKRFEKERKFYLISICLGLCFVLHAALYLFSPIGGDRTNWVDTTAWEWIIAASGIIILIWMIRRLFRLRNCRRDLKDGFIKPVNQVEHFDTGVSDSTLIEVVGDDYYRVGIVLPYIAAVVIYFLVVLPFYAGTLKKGEYIDWMAVFYPVYIVLVSGVFRIKKYRTIKELYSRGKLHIPNELKREIKSRKKRK